MSNSFIIDTDSLISPYHHFYPFDLAPGFWDQLQKHIEQGNIAILDLVKTEIDAGEDDLKDWLNRINIKTLVSHKNTDIIQSYGLIMQHIDSCNHYTIKAVKEWDYPAADPWLIAAAHTNEYTLVTFELPNRNLDVHHPSKKAKIPDVCEHFGVKCCNLYDMMRALPFNQFK